MDIKLYDFEFNLLGAENRYTSLNSEIYYNDIGKIEVHLPLSSKLLPIVMNQKYTVLKHGDKNAVVVGFTAFDEFILYCRTCNWLLTKRTVPPFSLENPVDGISLGTNLEDTARSIAEYAFSDVENFRCGDICGITDGTAFWRNARNIAFDVIKDCMNVCQGGNSLEFDVLKKRWVFVCLNGKTRDFTVSEAHRNAYDTEYSFDILDLLSCGYYEDKQEDAESTENVEKYIVKDEKSGIYRFEGKLSGQCESEAFSDLAKKCEKSVIKAKFRSLSYGKDYSLGDTVRIRIVKGNFRKTVQRRVIGIKQNYDENGYSEQPILEETE